MTIPVEIFTSLITQFGGITIGLITLVGVFITSRRAKSAEAHAQQAAKDASVTRAETRNSHNPEIPMRHDLDLVLANQQNDRKEHEAYREKTEAVQAQILTKLEDHDREFEKLNTSQVDQWKAIGAAEHVANTAAAAAETAAAAALKTAQTTETVVASVIPTTTEQ